MRYVLFNWIDPGDAQVWEAMTPEEQQHEVELHVEWFRRHREHVVGGEELDEPRTVKTLRPGRQGEGVVVTDGPYVEAKEILGGFVIIEAADVDEAIAIASAWAVADDLAEVDGPGAARIRPGLTVVVGSACVPTRWPCRSPRWRSASARGTGPPAPGCTRRDRPFSHPVGVTPLATPRSVRIPATWAPAAKLDGSCACRPTYGPLHGNSAHSGRMRRGSVAVPGTVTVRTKSGTGAGSVARGLHREWVSWRLPSPSSSSWSRSCSSVANAGRARSACAPTTAAEAPAR